MPTVVMPYAIHETPDGHASVVNTETGAVHSKHTTHAKAMAQIRLLRGIEHGTIIPHAAVDKGHFRSHDAGVHPDIATVKRYPGKVPSGVVASKAPHTKQRHLRTEGMAPVPKDIRYG